MELPKFLQIEPVGQCNLRCQMCPVQFRHDGPEGRPAFMSVEQLTLSPRPENPGILRCEIQVRALSVKQGSTNS